MAESRLLNWSRWLLEACLLFAITLTPLYFNIYSARHFEPDKAAALRTITLTAAAGAAMLFWAARTTGKTAAAGISWSVLRRSPLWWAGVVYAAVYLLTTLTSVVPGVSLWGSYQRLQGTYSVLSYAGLALLAPLVLREPASRERWLAALGAAAATAALYGLLQANQLDPLPWRGDTVTRVASTMGNSIFIAAFLIMVVPIAAARTLQQWRVLRTARPNAVTRRDELWFALAGLLHWAAGVMIVLTVIAFSGQVRAADARFWWVFPTAVAVATAFWIIPLRRGRGTANDWRPLAALLSFALFFTLAFAAGSATVQTVDDGRGLWQWWQWLLGAVLAAVGAVALGSRGAALPAEPSRFAHAALTAARAAVTLLLVLVVFFTQSRGPWIGLAAGIFVFGVLLVTVLRREADDSGDAAAQRRWTTALVGWLTTTVVLGALLIVFNVSQAPLFEQLRTVPYLGRMGRLLEVDSGTGLVRLLIWNGDEHGGGALGLVRSDPLRSLIGWGPESMFVAFTPFYPPALANVEARGASPDRSHQALLDDMVTRGALGLISYLLLFGAAAWSVRRVLRSADDFSSKVLIIGAVSALTAFFVEGLTGIPITMTQLLFWLLLALIGTAAVPATSPLPTPDALTATTPELQRRSTRRSVVQRGRGQTAASTGLSGWLLIPAVAVALVCGWYANQRPVYADMLFHQAQGLNESATDGSGKIRALARAIAAVRTNPSEDFYFLNLGRMLLDLGEMKRSQLGDIGAAGTVTFTDVLALADEAAVNDFVLTVPPAGLLAAAESVLQHAADLSPLNKDHRANLARVSTISFVWTNDPAQLVRAAERYRAVVALAPNDVALRNEYAGIILQQAQIAQQAGDAAAAESLFAEALALLNQSQLLDERYGDTYQRRGDLLRVRDGDPTEAVADYARAIALAPDAMAAAADRLLQIYAGQPQAIVQLRDAYSAAATAAATAYADAAGRQDLAFDRPRRAAAATQLLVARGRFEYEAQASDAAIAAFAEAVSLSPDDVTASRWYATVLSSTLRYDQALSETDRIAGRMQQLGRTDDLAVITALRAAISEAGN
jgi:tetratricopeptide (TPR) repeat protein